MSTTTTRRTRTLASFKFPVLFQSVGQGIDALPLTTMLRTARLCGQLYQRLSRACTDQISRLIAALKLTGTGWHLERLISYHRYTEFFWCRPVRWALNQRKRTPSAIPIYIPASGTWIGRDYAMRSKPALTSSFAILADLPCLLISPTYGS